MPKFMISPMSLSSENVYEAAVICMFQHRHSLEFVLSFVSRLARSTFLFRVASKRTLNILGCCTSAFEVLLLEVGEGGEVSFEIFGKETKADASITRMEEKIGKSSPHR